MKAGQTGPPRRPRHQQGDVMPQYLLSGFLPDNFDPSSVDEATVHNINVLNEELEAAGARLFAGGLAHPARRSRCGRSPMAKCSSPTARIWKPRSTLVVFGYWKPLTWTRRWRGAASLPSPARMPVEVREIPYSNLPTGTPHPSRQHRESREPPPAKPAPPPTSTTVSATATSASRWCGVVVSRL